MHVSELSAIGLLSLICLVLPWVSVLLRAFHLKDERHAHFVSTTSLCLQQLAVQMELVTLLVAYKFDHAIREHSVTNIMLVVSQWCCFAALLLITILRQGGNEPSPRRCSSLIDSIALLPAVHAVATVVLLNWTIYDEGALLARSQAFHELNAYFLTPVASVVVAAASALQIRRAYKARLAENVHALSNERFVLGYEATYYVAMAALWSISIELPISWSWYGLGGWACVNSSVRALGCAVSASLIAPGGKRPWWAQTRRVAYIDDLHIIRDLEKM